MKNVTITLDENVAKWARIRAAELDTSVSRLLGDLLREKMLNERAYEDPVKLKKPGAGYPRRDKLHAR
jgi:plasmid stability protein